MESKTGIDESMLYEVYKVFCKDNQFTPLKKSNFYDELHINMDESCFHERTHKYKNAWKGYMVIDEECMIDDELDA